MNQYKCSVIREELFLLTGDYKLALILNQMIYWSQRVRDVDAYIEEEKMRDQNSRLELTEGWFYKKAADLSKETFTLWSETLIRRCLIKLVEAGWLNERSNPKIKWDKTKQYRVSLVNIQRDLNKLGLQLQGYKVEVPTFSETTTEEKSTVEDKRQEANGDQDIHLKNVDATKPKQEKSDDEMGDTTLAEKIPYAEIIDYLNEQTGKKFKDSVRETNRMIRTRWLEKHRLEDFKKVIDQKTTQWLDVPEMNKYLRPETLFGTKFEAYLNEPEPTNRKSEFDAFLEGLDES
ncbi:conserved phage C-terminal domain-containing protein [Salipaludibacillus keqinensis]|nr:conserved phage C-terminal domain-containing protein [Salipaludibacillus keqinensis]